MTDFPLAQCGGGASLPSATAKLGDLTPSEDLLPPLRSLARRIAPSQGLVDCGGEGNCGPLAISFLLNRLGISDCDHRQLRAVVAAHAADRRTQQQPLHTSMVRNGKADLTVADVILTSFASAKQRDAPTVDAWCDRVSRNGTDFDTAALLVVADKFKVRIHVHLVDDHGADIDCPPISPPAQSAPVAALRLGAVANQHFVAVVDVEAESGSHAALSGSASKNRSVRQEQIEGSTSVYVECSHGFALVAGRLNHAVTPRCSRTACVRDARAWWKERGESAAPLPPGMPRADERYPAPYLESEAARKEYSLFDWPLRSVSDLRRLLACEHISPTDVIGFEFSGAVRQSLEREGRIALSVDRRECEAGGMHACLEVQDVLGLSRWRAAYLFPSCFQQLVGDADCLPLKLSDGRAFWGCLQVVWCLFAPADMTIVEQPEVVVHDFLLELGADCASVRTSALGDSPDKLVRLYSARATIDLQPPGEPPPRPPRRERSQFQFADADARDRYRSSWRPFVNLCSRVARARPSRSPCRLPSTYAEAAERFAVWWHGRGWHVPAGYLHSRALPPTAEQREYQLTRGPGDGRGVDAVVPSSLRLVAGGVQDSDGFADPIESSTLSDLGSDFEESAADDAASRPTPTEGEAPPDATDATIDQLPGDTTLLGHPECSGCEGAGCPLCEGWSDIRDLLSCGASDTAAASLSAPSAPPQIDARAVGAAAIVCIFISVLMHPLVLAHANGFTVIGIELPERASRPDSLARAQRWVSAAIGTSHLAYMVGEYVGGARVCAAPIDFAPPESDICRTPRERRGKLMAGAAFVWCTLAALAGAPSGDLAARAIVATEAFLKPVSLLADFSPAQGVTHTFRFGAAAATSVVRAPLLDPSSGPPAWRLLARSHAHDSALRDAIREASGDELLSGWLERIMPINAADIPPSLLAHTPGFTDAALEGLAFTPVYTPIETPWLPLPPRQPPASPDAPACVESPFDMMLPETQATVNRWLGDALADMLHIRSELEKGTPPESIERRRPPPLAVGQTELHEWARGRVWDCTRETAPCCIVADFHAPITTHLDREYLRERLADYPDQTLVANLLEGARLDADVELQTVLIPHLQSLPFGFASVERELRKLKAKGWYAFFSTFPYWPFYLNGQGSICKRLTPDVWRRITEGGGPRQDICDASGLRALSINAASKIYHVPQHFASDSRVEMREWLAARGLPRPPDESLPEGFSKWPKETKPTVDQLMRDLSILRRAAEMLNEPIYIFVEDAAAFFNQLRMAACERHKLGIVFIAADGDLPPPPTGASAGPRLVFVSEKVLGFGTHGASNIAQRFSESLLYLFRQDMDEADFAASSSDAPGMEEWRRARAAAQERSGQPCIQRRFGAVCPQERLYSVFMYTDDPAFVVVGVARTIRALRTWRRLTNRVGLIMAIPEKRSLGSHAVWLGVIFIASLGLVVVPRPKLLRAAKSIRHALDRGVPFHEWRALCGLLEHLRAVNLKGRNVMHGLYRPHGAQGVGRFGPAATVRCDPLMRQQLQRWLSMLASSGGVSARHAILRDEAAPPPSLHVALCADACLGDDDPAGIGGFCHGLYWHFAIPPEHYPLVTTPLLEFLATATNFLVFFDYLHAMDEEGVSYIFRTDALTTALTLPRESQKSKLLVETFQWLRRRREFRLLSHRAKVAHLFGDCNPFSDRISRGKTAEFRRLCAQVGIRPTCVPLPDGFRELYDHVIERASQPPELEAGLLAIGHCGSRRPRPFLERLREAGCREPVPEPIAAPSSAPAPGFLSRLGRAPSPTSIQANSRALELRAHPSGPTLSPIAGLALPSAPPVRPERRKSSLTAASVHYARARAAALSSGDDTMALRTEITKLCGLGELAEAYGAYGVNINTSSKDDRAWVLWEQVCDRAGTSPLRTSADVRDYPEKNAFLLTLLLLHAFAVGIPKDKSRRFIKPKSALAYPLAIIRIFKRWSINMPGYQSLVAQLHGMSRLYIAYHGPHSLSPRRAEPMRFAMVRRINDYPASATSRLGPYAWDDNNLLVFMFRRLNLFLIRTGFRLGEIVWHASNEIMYLTRACLTWRINGVLYSSPTPQVLGALTPGRDCALVAPPRAKPDQWGEIHCPFPVTLTYSADPDNAAAALRDIELRVSCAPDEREAVPLFCNADRTPLRHSIMDAMLRNVLSDLYGANVAALYSWHSYRSGLATALHAAGVPDATIMLICRWMCDASLHVYRRIGTAEHEVSINKAAGARVDLIQSVNVPIVSNDQRYAELLSDLAGPRQATMARNFDRGDIDTHDDDAPSPSPRPHQARLARAPPTQPLTTAPLIALSGPSDVGRRVLVSRGLWPAYACTEHGGAGWEAVIRSASRTTAVVRFSNARTARGVPYADERLPLSSLQPL